MRPEPYISVTGATTASQVISLLDCQPPQGYKLGIGILVSSCTVMGEDVGHHHFPKRYPQLGLLDRLHRKHPNAFNVVHFWSRADQIPRFKEFIDLILAASPYVDAIQFNNANAPITVLKQLKAENAQLKFIIPLTRSVLENNPKPSDLAAYVARYAEIADYFLYDASGGKGLPLDRERALVELQYLENQFPGRFGWAVAGGLGPFTTHYLNGFFSRIPGLSCDAEGELRDSEDEFFPLLAENYILEMTKIICHTRG